MKKYIKKFKLNAVKMDPLRLMIFIVRMMIIFGNANNLVCAALGTLMTIRMTNFGKPGLLYLANQRNSTVNLK